MLPFSLWIFFFSPAIGLRTSAAFNLVTCLDLKTRRVFCLHLPSRRIGAGNPNPRSLALIKFARLSSRMDSVLHHGLPIPIPIPIPIPNTYTNTFRRLNSVPGKLRIALGWAYAKPSGFWVVLRRRLLIIWVGRVGRSPSGMCKARVLLYRLRFWKGFSQEQLLGQLARFHTPITCRRLSKLRCCVYSITALAFLFCLGLR